MLRPLFLPSRVSLSAKGEEADFTFLSTCNVQVHVRREDSWNSRWQFGIPFAGHIKGLTFEPVSTLSHIDGSETIIFRYEGHRMPFSLPLLFSHSPRRHGWMGNSIPTCLCFFPGGALGGGERGGGGTWIVRGGGGRDSLTGSLDRRRSNNA